MLRHAMTGLKVFKLASSALAMDGMIELPSAHAPHASVDRLEAIAKAHEMKVFVHIDHAAGARSIGQELRPTEPITFGNPKSGTPLMLRSRTYGIDLPLRVLAWQDAKGASRLGYSDLATLRHVYPDAGCDEAIKSLTATLDVLVREAAKP